MEKKKPTYDLMSIQETFNSVKNLSATSTAIKGAGALGMGRSEIVDTIQNLTRKDFVKSMTSYADHTVWQDVYNATTEYGLIYIKFTQNCLSEFLLLSFKEK